jgi:hypothetical protein
MAATALEKCWQARRYDRNRVEYSQLPQDSGHVRIGYGAENLGVE